MLLTKHLVEHSVPFSYVDVSTVIVRLRRQAKEWCGEQLRPFLLQCLFTSDPEGHSNSCQDHNYLAASCACERKFGAVDREAGLVAMEVEVDGSDGGHSEGALGTCGRLRVHDAEWRASDTQVGEYLHEPSTAGEYFHEDVRTPRGAMLTHMDSLGVTRGVKVIANLTPLELRAVREKMDDVRALYVRIGELDQSEAWVLSDMEMELELELELAGQIQELAIATRPILDNVVGAYEISL